MSESTRATLSSKVFSRAAEDVGSVKKLAILLHLPANEVEAVIAGKMIPDQHVFEGAVDLILKYEP
jgi:hypothetical protein